MGLRNAIVMQIIPDKDQSYCGIMVFEWLCHISTG